MSGQFSDAARQRAGDTVRRLNPALFKARAELGLGDHVDVARAHVEFEEAPDPVPAARTNAGNDGRRWQETVAATAADYERRRVLCLEKTDPAVRIVGGKEDRRVIFKKSRLVDFVGCHTARGGRAIFLEAKCTSEERLPLGRPGGLTAAQVSTLRAWALGGAMAALLWRTPAGAWLCPYRDILRAALDGRKSLLPAHCMRVELVGAVRLPDGSQAERPDFAPVLERAYPRECA